MVNSRETLGGEYQRQVEQATTNRYMENLQGIERRLALGGTVIKSGHSRTDNPTGLEMFIPLTVGQRYRLEWNQKYLQMRLGLETPNWQALLTTNPQNNYHKSNQEKYDIFRQVFTT